MNIYRGELNSLCCYMTSPFETGNSEIVTPKTTETEKSGVLSRLAELSLAKFRVKIIKATDHSDPVEVIQKIIKLKYKATDHSDPLEIIEKIIKSKYSEQKDKDFYLSLSKIFFHSTFGELINENVFLAVSNDKIVGFLEGHVWEKTVFYIKHTGSVKAEETSHLSSAEIKKGLMLSVMERVKQYGCKFFELKSLMHSCCLNTSENENFKEECDFFIEDFKKLKMKLSESCFSENGYRDYTITYDLETLPDLKTLKELNSFS